MADLPVAGQDGRTHLSQSTAKSTGEEASTYGRLVPNLRSEDPTNASSAEDSDHCPLFTFADFHRVRPSVRTVPPREKFRIAKSIRERKAERYPNGKGKADLGPSRAIPSDLDVLPSQNSADWPPPYLHLAPSEPTTAVEDPRYLAWNNEMVNVASPINNATYWSHADSQPSFLQVRSGFDPYRGPAGYAAMAAVPAQQQQYLTLPFPTEAAAEPAGIEVASMDDPPTDEFRAWAGKQPKLEGSPGQISIWSHFSKKPEATVERWYQELKIQEAPVSTEDLKTLPTTPEVTGEPGLSRVKCIDKKRLRGRYIDSADSAARGPFSCTSGCGMNFARKADWRRHEDNNYPIEEWTCMICRQSFARQDKLTSHVRTVHKNEGFTASDVNYQPLPDNHNRHCPVCRIAFVKVKDFYAHVSNVEHFRPTLSNSAPVEQGQDSIATGNRIDFGSIPPSQQLSQYGNSEALVVDDSYSSCWASGNANNYQTQL